METDNITRQEIERALQERHTGKIQKKIRKAKVAVAGLGGLGSHIAFALARMGVGHLHLIDFDKVELTNLNRQQYFLDQIGMYKTEALKQNLLKINPYLEIRTDCVHLEESNIKTVLLEDKFICEAFDVPENKAMLAQTVLENFPEKYLVAASGMAGYEDSNAILTRKISSHFYLCGDEKTEAQKGAGLMAPRVLICAGHQANMILRLILGADGQGK